MAGRQPETGRGELRVGAHVLVQLGAELVTDAEQALLECVKNAYDADAPGCRVVIDTRSEGELVAPMLAAEAFRFSAATEGVSVRVEAADAEVVEEGGLPPDAPVVRRLSYCGSVVIEDHGIGISYSSIGKSWLVVSGSAKRVALGPKARTALGRTPLGDKGLGRLGTMKLGDVLLVESATSADEELSYAWFRWADCETAATVDEVPVVVGRNPNALRFKGTRVSVLGLHDVAEWRRPRRLAELTRSMARLISPFEAASAFPVSLILDEREQSLAMVTDELLNQAVASFSFDWQVDGNGAASLHATARLGRRLFTSGRTGPLKQRTAEVFGEDGGRGFASHLRQHRRFRNFEDVSADPEARWFFEITRTVSGAEVLGQDLDAQPGPFSGAFYYYFFVQDPNDAPAEDEERDEGAVIGARSSLKVVRDLAGIAILRDGFQVRNSGDWLDLSAGMTTGSTYNMRPENTIGYFALTGAENWRLKEKSDREGFVDDASYRAFLTIARYCRNFANNALVAARRTLDEYFKEMRGPPPVDASGAAKRLGAAGSAVRLIGDLGDELGALLAEADDADSSSSSPIRRERAMALAAQVISAARAASGDLEPDELVRVIEDEATEARSRNVALVESAAVGQAARGMVHEIRTHLEEIRFKAGAIERDKAGTGLRDNLTAIRRSCSAIGAAAAEIDPMLPRSRAMKDRLDLRKLVEDYFSQRTDRLAETGVAYRVSGGDVHVRINRARLLQVIDNLVRNSVYWLGRGPREDRWVDVDIGPQGFVVSDTGPGIDPVVEETLFDLFVTMRSQEDGGQGLGLFISAELLALDGCSIALLPDRNSAGRRYRFRVDLAPVVIA